MQMITNIASVKLEILIPSFLGDCKYQYFMTQHGVTKHGSFSHAECWLLIISQTL